MSAKQNTIVGPDSAHGLPVGDLRGRHVGTEDLFSKGEETLGWHPVLKGVGSKLSGSDLGWRQDKGPERPFLSTWKELDTQTGHWFPFKASQGKERNFSKPKDKDTKCRPSREISKNVKLRKND